MHKTSIHGVGVHLHGVYLTGLVRCLMNPFVADEPNLRMTWLVTSFAEPYMV